MSELKTKATDASVEDFLNAIEHPTRKSDGLKLLEIFKKETGMNPSQFKSQHQDRKSLDKL